jgi:hypothetical protein
MIIHDQNIDLALVWPVVDVGPIFFVQHGAAASHLVLPTSSCDIQGWREAIEAKESIMASLSLERVCGVDCH